MPPGLLSRSNDIDLTGNMNEVQSLILWQDDILLVVDKPAGLPTLPDGYNPQAPCLVNLLKQVYQPLWVVHRLDKDTSGVIVFALSAQAHRNLNTQFEGRQASKLYHALVHGSPGWETTRIALPLRPNGDRRHRTVIDQRSGKPAITDLRVLERLGDFTLVEAAPRTGRTHQIRAHLAACGHPILSDPLYHNRPPGSRPSTQPGAPPLIERLALHAFSLTLLHPTSGAPQEFTAPYPADFARALEHREDP